MTQPGRYSKNLYLNLSIEISSALKMITEYKVCPNCDKKLNGLMTTKSMVNPATVAYINYFKPTKQTAYCTGCAPGLVQKYLEQQDLRITKIQMELQKVIKVIPIVTAHSPLNWDYKVKGIVSAQSVSGTGFITEVSSSFSDLFGGQSDALGTKLNNGELICRSQLRFKTAMLGGNAVIATDIDYAEVGGVKGMLMVCMAGTAVRLNNLQEVMEIDNQEYKTMETLVNELIEIGKVKPPKDLS
jgi:uncharacterized protein YbjQ (UPF0145 family)